MRHFTIAIKYNIKNISKYLLISHERTNLVAERGRVKRTRHSKTFNINIKGCIFARQKIHSTQTICIIIFM